MFDLVKMIMQPYKAEIKKEIRKRQWQFALLVVFGLFFAVGVGLVATNFHNFIFGDRLQFLIGLGCIFVAFVLLIILVIFRIFIKRDGTGKSLNIQSDDMQELYRAFLSRENNNLKVVDYQEEISEDKHDLNTVWFESKLFRYKFVTETWLGTSAGTIAANVALTIASATISALAGGGSSGGSGGANVKTNRVIYNLEKAPLGTTKNGEKVAEISAANGIDKSDFQSESITFNKMFHVSGKDQQKMTKFFTPLVMDQMTNIPKGSFKGRGVLAYEKAVVITDERSSVSEANYALNNFVTFCFSYRSFIDKVIKKIQNDLKVMYTLNNLAAPFDFDMK
jgi:hypothetical protein